MAQGASTHSPHNPDVWSSTDIQEDRNFSTSSRAFSGSSPRADPEGAREPVETETQGDQNAHLKHTSGGSKGKTDQGNAAPEPHLPSKSKGQSEIHGDQNAHLKHTSGGSKGQASQGNAAPEPHLPSQRKFSTSTRVAGAPPTDKYAKSYKSVPSAEGNPVSQAQSMHPMRMLISGRSIRGASCPSQVQLL